MNQLLLQQDTSKELADFAHIKEFAYKKNTTIQLNSFNVGPMDCIGIYYVLEGKHNWVIGATEHTLYPGDIAVILPGENFGGKNNILNIGSLMWVKLNVQNHRQLIGDWSQLSKKERNALEQILSVNKDLLVLNIKEAQSLFFDLKYELQNAEVGFCTRITQLLDHLFIIICRQLIRQNHSRRDFPTTFLRLEQTLRQNLARQWTVEEMAAFAGMGTTAFTEKVKNYSGFSPLNYLINLRITEAIKLLKRNEVNVTDIALAIGFYSSQHFSTTFKKLTGYTPSEFRKNNIQTNNLQP
ncbi:AraC family transcriptional regulator [Mucilaginibacter calamicampi]|uniref:AraC family transcriptional regulator n=1 Tax=Mucilaginibacter calamicampi TaxID=1302352 RepID=A0ABW2YXY9_9SPHI